MNDTNCEDVECMGGGTCVENDEGYASCICPLGKTTYGNKYWCEGEFTVGAT